MSAIKGCVKTTRMRSEGLFPLMRAAMANSRLYKFVSLRSQVDFSIHVLQPNWTP